MKKNVISIIWVLLYIGANAQTEGFVTDKFSTKNGDLTITFIGHASLMFEFQGKIIHIDPFSKVGDYSKLPKADLILLTHQHRDHLDTVAMRLIVKPETDIWVSESC
ncbi:MAG TPA: metal-dependent hydrolase, partial [Bacteroidales bacterium]|nr:metal-dependent hydrolase [Bacteroidales bacterium]